MIWCWFSLVRNFRATSPPHTPASLHSFPESSDCLYSTASAQVHHICPSVCSPSPTPWSCKDPIHYTCSTWVHTCQRLCTPGTSVWQSSCRRPSPIQWIQFHCNDCRWSHAHPTWCQSPRTSHIWYCKGTRWDAYTHCMPLQTPSQYWLPHRGPSQSLFTSKSPPVFGFLPS